MNQYHVRIVGPEVTLDYKEVKASSSRIAVSKAMKDYGKQYGESKLRYSVIRVTFVAKIVKHPVEVKQ